MTLEMVNVGGRVREMSVKKHEGTTEKMAAHLKARGWDGAVYFVYGPRGAHKMAYRSAATGELKTVW